MKKCDEQFTKEEILKELRVDDKEGLNSEEVKKRQEKYGKNELKEEKKKNWIQIFISQLNDPLIFVLFAAISVTIGVSLFETINTIKSGETFNFLETGDWPDVIIILAVIILNAVVGTVQEIKANTSLEALKKMSSPESTVLREGKRQKIKSNELVPGDIVFIEEGDTVGADLRLIETTNLKINESSLTGESVPVNKDANITFSEKVGIGEKINMAFMSTPVSYGRGVGVVVKIGMNTEIGKIANALNNDKQEQTPLQKVLSSLTKTLGILTLIIVFCVLIVNLMWIFIDGKGGEIESYIEAILSSVSLAVAAVPEGLAAVVTIVLSIVVQKMVKANTIVRKLPSVETLGAVSIICSDKTGTLTQNKMTVIKAYVNSNIVNNDEFNNQNEGLVLLSKGLSLCNNAIIDNGEYGDPTEIALVAFSNKLGMSKKELEAISPRIDEIPFDSNRKMRSTMHVENNKKIIYTKGAIDSILKHTTRILDNGKIRKIEKEDIENINKINSEFSSCALRVLALGMNNNDLLVEKDLIFIGLVGMIDPPRVEAKEAVTTLKEAGITTIMITGDHKDTAFAIAKELGICQFKEQCITGSEVDGMSKEELQKVVKEARVFARVSPNNKVQIVNAFKDNGNIVAMTGDGVNDAPSLTAADIGIAMGITGTDVAKSAADMILTDDNFASIEKAVEEGRNIFSNIKKTVLFLLSTNITEVLAMFFIIAVGLPSPFLAIHLLWVNLVTDSFPSIVLGMSEKNPDCMKKKPRNIHESIFANGGKFTIALYGFIITLAGIIAYLVPAWMNGVFSYSSIKTLYSSELYLLQAQTMAFTTLALSELIHMVGISDTERSFIHVFLDKKWMMGLAVIVGVILQIIVIEIPLISRLFSTANLNFYQWIVTCLLAFIPLIVHEIIVVVKKYQKHTN